MSTEYKWIVNEEGDPIDCDVCDSRVPLKFWERTFTTGKRWIHAWTCNVCDNSSISNYPNHRTRAEEIALSAANSVLLALFSTGLFVFSPRTERLVVKLNDEDGTYYPVEVESPSCPHHVVKGWVWIKGDKVPIGCKVNRITGTVTIDDTAQEMIREECARLNLKYGWFEQARVHMEFEYNG